MSDNKLSRKEQNAILKARYEEDKARKKAEKELKRAAREGDKAASGVVKQAADPIAIPTPEVPTYEIAEPAPGAAKAKRDKRVRSTELGEKQGAAVSKAEKARRGALPGEVRTMLLERKVILSQWRSLKIEPKDAVVRLSALSATDADGATWRLLPRPGGTALVKTTTDGATTIVEPPVRRRKGVAVATAVLFGILAGAAIWSSFNPITDSGEKSGETAVSTTLSGSSTTVTAQGGR
jgi:hypothetical protein